MNCSIYCKSKYSQHMTSGGFSHCFRTMSNAKEEVKFSSVHTLLLLFSFPPFLCLVLSCLKLCQWPCLSLCGQLCHRWSITTGGGLLLAEPRGPADPDKWAVNASPQPTALIGSDRHSGPYASFMPLDPRCRQVCVCVPFSTTLFSTCCWGFMSLVSFPLFPWLNST